MKKAPKTKKGKAKPKVQRKGRTKKKKGPRSQVLPGGGMDAVRNGDLDNLCEEIAEERESSNQAKTREKASTAKALAVMQAEKYTVYKHAGVELVRVPGADKLRVRLVDDEGDAAVTTDGTSASTQDDLAAGQDGAQ